MTRELRSVRTEAVLGSITVADGAVAYQGVAESVLAAPVRRFGVDAVMAGGWSNGYLYLTDPIDDPSKG